jgi:hypothetical protein
MDNTAMPRQRPRRHFLDLHRLAIFTSYTVVEWYDWSLWPSTKVRFGSRLCEKAAVAAHRKVGAELCFGVRDRRTVQARIASISDCGPSMASIRFRL